MFKNRIDHYIVTRIVVKVVSTCGLSMSQGLPCALLSDVLLGNLVQSCSILFNIVKYC